MYATADGGATWLPTQQITPSVIEPSSTFGTSVALAGSTLFVGAPNGTINVLLGYFLGVVYFIIFSWP